MSEDHNNENEQAHHQATPERWIGESGFGRTFSLGIYLAEQGFQNGLFLSHLEARLNALDRAIVLEWLRPYLSAPSPHGGRSLRSVNKP